MNGGAGLLINYCAVDDMTYQYSLYNEIKMQYGCKLFENVKKQQQKYPMGICIYQVKWVSLSIFRRQCMHIRLNFENFSWTNWLRFAFDWNLWEYPGFEYAGETIAPKDFHNEREKNDHIISKAFSQQLIPYRK